MLKTIILGIFFVLLYTRISTYNLINNVYFFHSSFISIIIIAVIFSIIFYWNKANLNENKYNKKLIKNIFLSVTSLAIIIATFITIYIHYTWYSTLMYYLLIWVMEEYIKIIIVLIGLVYMNNRRFWDKKILFWNFINYYIFAAIIFWITETFITWMGYFLTAIIHITYLTIPFFIFQMIYDRKTNLYYEQITSYKYTFITIILLAMFLHSIFDLIWYYYPTHIVLTILFFLVWIFSFIYFRKDFL